VVQIPSKREFLWPFYGYGNNKTHSGLHVKWQIFFYIDFNQISRNFVQSEPSYMRIDRRTDMTKLAGGSFCDLRERTYKIHLLSRAGAETHRVLITKVTPIMPLTGIIAVYHKNAADDSWWSKHGALVRPVWCWMCPEAVEKKHISFPCLGLNPISSVLHPHPGHYADYTVCIRNPKYCDLNPGHDRKTADTCSSRVGYEDVQR
jgi:hypothetical protein